MTILRITPVDWNNFQHYKNRRPPWIKVHRKILEDVKFARLQHASKALALHLWMLASEYDGGEIVDSDEQISFRVLATCKQLASALIELKNNGFFTLASETLAWCLQHASPEYRGRDSEEESSDSLANARESGAGAPDLLAEIAPPPEARPSAPTQSSAIFNLGVPLIVASGKSEKDARSILGRMIRDHGQASVFDKVTAAITAQPGDPVAWLTKALNGRPRAVGDDFEHSGDWSPFR